MSVCYFELNLRFLPYEHDVASRETFLSFRDVTFQWHNELLDSPKLLNARHAHLRFCQTPDTIHPSPLLVCSISLQKGVHSQSKDGSEQGVKADTA
jgi:hypothetical protein